MSTGADRPPREDLREILRRDLKREAERERGHGTFWRSLGLLGAVGWLIVVPVVGGALVGHYLDGRLHSGMHFTLIFMAAGILLGSVAAWRCIAGHR